MQGRLPTFHLSLMHKSYAKKHRICAVWMCALLSVFGCSIDCVLFVVLRGGTRHNIHMSFCAIPFQHCVRPLFRFVQSGVRSTVTASTIYQLVLSRILFHLSTSIHIVSLVL